MRRHGVSRDRRPCTDSVYPSPICGRCYFGYSPSGARICAVPIWTWPLLPILLLVPLGSPLHTVLLGLGCGLGVLAAIALPRMQVDVIANALSIALQCRHAPSRRPLRLVVDALLLAWFAQLALSYSTNRSTVPIRPARWCSSVICACVDSGRCRVVLATRALDIVARYADRAALLYEGRPLRGWNADDLARLRATPGDDLDAELALAMQAGA